MFGDGERNARFSAAMASSNVMSNLILSSDCRETWQYEQLCSHLRVTTKMCNDVKSESRAYLLRTFIAKRSFAMDVLLSVRKCFDLNSMYAGSSVRS